MGRFSIAVFVIQLGLALSILTSGCAGELTEEQKQPRAGASGAAGSGAGGSGVGGAGGSGAGAGGSGGTAGGGGENPEACFLALSKAKSCAVVGCHGGSSPAAQLVLTDDAIRQAKTSLVDKTNKGAMPGCNAGMFKLIDSARPENSLLYTKLAAMPPCGVRMPSGSSVSDAEMSCVLAWIRSVAGAP